MKNIADFEIYVAVFPEKHPESKNIIDDITSQYVSILEKKYFKIHVNIFGFIKNGIKKYINESKE